MSSQNEAVAALKFVRVQAELMQTLQTLQQLEALMECGGTRNPNHAQIKELRDALDARADKLLKAFDGMVSEHMEAIEGGAA